MKIIVVIIYFCSYSGLFLIGKDFFVEYLFFVLLLQIFNGYLKIRFYGGQLCSYFIYVMLSDDFIKSCIKIIKKIYNLWQNNSIVGFIFVIYYLIYK